MNEDFFKDFLEDLISSINLIKCNDLRNMINFCRETYDNWKDIKLEYSVQIKKNTELQFDITNFNLNGDILFLESREDNEILTLKQLDDFLDTLVDTKENWGDILIMCDNDVEIDGEINQLPVSTFIDEEDFIFSFIL
jgi:phosphoglucomutase